MRSFRSSDDRLTVERTHDIGGRLEQTARPQPWRPPLTSTEEGPLKPWVTTAGAFGSAVPRCGQQLGGAGDSGGQSPERSRDLDGERPDAAGGADHERGLTGL
jgi:hypothetical protein